MDQQLAENMLTVSLFVSLVLNVLTPLIKSAGVVSRLSADAYSALIRILGYALNFGFLVALLGSQGTLDFGHQWYAYLAAALGQQIVSHVTYKVGSGSASNTSTAPSADADRGTSGETPVAPPATPPTDPEQTATAVASAVTSALAQS